MVEERPSSGFRQILGCCINFDCSNYNNRTQMSGRVQRGVAVVFVIYFNELRKDV